ncbi:anhydro-N-acetylmuramic acid kinase [Fodinibius sp. Rm-B-1B1-1]|uniref:anhydro-N-acetylmuramic acid kinase n=1 Tax=Fodinibius alkaliphilus TaxID=3140241 RepID=UPI00315AECDD
MNPSVKKLIETASKESKLIIGLMSGTSLDGLDIALAKVAGSGANTSVELLKFMTKDYQPELKKRLKAISSVPQVSLEKVCLLHSKLAELHAEFILSALDQWDITPNQIDCIASHGQTIYHAPKIQHQQDDMPNTTLQIGDGDHLAHKTGILTISDFRQKHTAAGGEGAPMVSFVDRALYTHKTKDRILLNIGGIANFTYLPSREKSAPVITTDTGPGNTLIDASMQSYFSKPFDKDGQIAQSGSVHKLSLEKLKADPYFQKPLPKTTGPEVFNLEWVQQQLDTLETEQLAPKNLVATLTHLSAQTIAESIKKVVPNLTDTTIYVSGGGFHNPALMQGIAESLPGCRIESFAEIGFDPDAKEAVLFAVLANEMLSGEGFLMDTDKEKINFGKISFPS